MHAGQQGDLMKAEATPPSVNLLESMRSVGYSLESAVADLLDNSISAAATLVQIDADVSDGQFIAILDNGRGMSSDEAKEALRLAGSVGQRAEDDLGRFGLGLKTASLSQGRCLTVVTKQGTNVSALRWDINYVRDTGEWLLQVLDTAELGGLPLWNVLNTQETGTLVIWSNLDLLLGDSISPGTFLAERLQDLRDSLELTFHRFLAGTDRIEISVNGVPLNAFDPFLTTNPKTQRSAPEIVAIGDEEVTVEAFTLPHPSGLTAKELSRRDLGEGMRAFQGFYIYRNKRLISHGHWFGLARTSELSKLTRVKVDVPAALDSLWQLDIKKSRIEPPQSFKLRLRQLIDPILEKGKRVHTFRGRKQHSEVTHVWTKLTSRGGAFSYEVNLQSPVIASVLAGLPEEDAAKVVGMLQTISDTFPIMDAYVEVASNARHRAATPLQDEILDKLRSLRASGIFSSAAEEAVTQIINVEPYNSVEELSTLVDMIWKEPHAS